MIRGRGRPVREADTSTKREYESTRVGVDLLPPRVIVIIVRSIKSLTTGRSMHEEDAISATKRPSQERPRATPRPVSVQYDTNDLTGPLKLPLHATFPHPAGAGGLLESVLQTLDKKEVEAVRPPSRSYRKNVASKTREKKRTCHSLYTPSDPHSGEPAPGGNSPGEDPCREAACDGGPVVSPRSSTATRRLLSMSPVRTPARGEGE